MLAGVVAALAGCEGQIPDQGGADPDRRIGYFLILAACGVTFGLLAIVAAFSRDEGKDDEAGEREE